MHSLDIVEHGEPLLPENSTAPEAQHADVFALALASLRGRYILAVILGLVGMVAGAWLGWRNGHIAYRSEGLIRIDSPGLNAAVGQTSDAYMRSQILAISGSDSLVKSAMQETAWKETGRGDAPAMRADFLRKLKVERPLGSQDGLRISYEDSDPVVAAAAVRSMIKAYANYHDDQINALQATRLKILDGPVQEDRASLEKAQKELDELLGAPPSRVDNFSLQEAKKNYTLIQQQLDDVRQKIDYVNQHPEMARTVTVGVSTATTQDPDLRNALNARWEIEEELRLNTYGADHPHTRQLLSQLEAAKARVQKRNEELQAQSPMNPDAAGAAASTPEENLEALKQQEKRLNAAQAAADDSIDKISIELEHAENTQRKVEDLRRNINGLRSDLQQQEMKRLDLIQTMQLTNLLEVMSQPEVPVTPSVDNRIKYAGVGGMGGMILPIGLLVIFGFLNPKYRYADEMTRDLGGQSGIALLGVLPVVKAGSLNLEHSADAAQAVHQIRVLLQMGRRQGAKLFLISSASPGEGKTSLTVGLGLSFMASGARTLIIDCDLVGQNLTRGFGAGGEKGLYEVMGGVALKSYVRPIRPGLSLLPVGRAHSADACAVSAQALQPVLAAAREQYDIVLVDSGPLLGSVEASVLATQVDQVVMTISRGQHPALLERTFTQLRSLGASVAGCVFNRAAPRDFMQSSANASVRSMSAGPLVPTTPRQQSRFGPLVESIMMFMPRTEEA